VAKVAARQAKTLLGYRVAELRRELNLTQEELAEQMGCGPRQVQRIEAGQANLTLDAIVALANALRTELALLFAAPRSRPRRAVGRPRNT
jgi:transcriptional regulator with XRE-family HTH domain